jgi:hypothetical protein
LAINCEEDEDKFFCIGFSEACKTCANELEEIVLKKIGNQEE